LSEKLQSIVIVGAGYVGLGTAAAFAEVGHRVWCVDKDGERIANLAAHNCPISERDLRETLTLHAGRLHYATDFELALQDSGAKLVFIAVGTPPADDGAADLSSVFEIVDEMPASSNYALVMKSTVPPGTGKRILARRKELGKRFAYVSCPEFMREGEALADLRRPDRVVIGAEDRSWAADLVRDLHGDLDSRPIFVQTDITSAEMIKYASNFHLAMRICFANEIANLCEEAGADAREVLHGVGLDARIGPGFLEPGVGFGGSCFSKDVKALRSTAAGLGCQSLLADAVLEINERQADRVIEKLEHGVGSLEGQRVALLGLAFKPGTGDLRAGSAFALAARLRSLGALVQAWDPNEDARTNALRQAEDKVMYNEWISLDEMADKVETVFSDAVACVLVTEWNEFRSIDWDAAKFAMSGDLVIDGRNALRAETVRAAGLRYEGTGRHSKGLPSRTGTPQVRG
jgi:UDPglucose 6-dehydrogenase